MGFILIFYFKGSINELIEKFDDDVNAIIETYDINAETNGKLSEKLEKGKKKINYYYKKVRGVIITFIVLLTVVTISVPVIVNIMEVFNDKY